MGSRRRCASPGPSTPATSWRCCRGNSSRHSTWRCRSGPSWRHSWASRRRRSGSSTSLKSRNFDDTVQAFAQLCADGPKEGNAPSELSRCCAANDKQWRSRVHRFIWWLNGGLPRSKKEPGQLRSNSNPVLYPAITCKSFKPPSNSLSLKEFPTSLLFSFLTSRHRLASLSPA